MIMKIEWLILADSAQVHGNKLYLLGGGWDRLTVQGKFPSYRSCSLALSFSVPWAETNQRHQFNVRFLDEDGNEIHQSVNGRLETGRPPGLPAGSDQRVQLAIDFRLKFEKPGGYVIEVTLNERETARTTFNVIHSPK
jgi:hypothetical protein